MTEKPIRLGIVSFYKSEMKKLFYCALSLFLLMTSYYIMKAIRSSSFLHEFGAISLLPTYVINGILTFLAVIVYNKLAAKYDRRTLIKRVFLAVTLIFLGIWSLNFLVSKTNAKVPAAATTTATDTDTDTDTATATDTDTDKITAKDVLRKDVTAISNTQKIEGLDNNSNNPPKSGKTFSAFLKSLFTVNKIMILINYFTVCIYILILTALLWSLINVVLTSSQASRLVGIILLAGQGGASLGGRITKMLAKSLGTMNLIPISLLILGATYLAMQKIQEFDTKDSNKKENKDTTEDSSNSTNKKSKKEPAKPEKKSSGSLSDLRDLIKHPYARVIGILILFSMFAVTTVDWQFNEMLEKQITGKDAKTEFFGQYYEWQGLINIGLLILAGKVIPLFGPAAGLLLLPIIAIIASINFFFAKTLGVAVWLWLLCHSTNYTFYNAGKEVLYSPAEREVKVRFKPLNDAAGYRGGDAAAAIFIGSYLLLLPGVAVSGIGIAVLVAGFLWIPTIFKANKMYYKAIKNNNKNESPLTKQPDPQE